MKFVFISIIALCLGQTIVIASVRKNCYGNYAPVSQDLENQNIYLRLIEKRDKDADKIKVYNPIDFGVDITKSLNHELFHYYSVIEFLETEKLDEMSDDFEYIKCLYDVWILSEIYAPQSSFNQACRNNFMNNVQVFEGLAKKRYFRPMQYPARNIANDYKKCKIIYFQNNSDAPIQSSLRIMEDIIQMRNAEEGVIINGVINWYNEPHFGQVNTKKRILFVKQMLNIYKIPNELIRGSVSEFNTTKLDMNFIEVCTFNTTSGTFPGRKIKNQ